MGIPCQLLLCRDAVNSGGRGALLKTKTLPCICLKRMGMFYCALLFLSSLHLAFSEPIDEVFAAIKGGKENDVKRILEENAESLESFINKQDPASGQTPLMMAVLMGKEEVVRMLLKLPVVDATIPEKDGYTPFHGAGFQGRASIARMLVKDSRGLDPNDRHKDGFQPIHRACWGMEARHAETVKVLVEEGGVPWDSKGKGKTPLQITQNSKTKAWLKEWGKRLQKGTEL